jgi:hypothetical protein
VLVVVPGVRLTSVVRVLVVGMLVGMRMNRPIAVPMFVLVLEVLVRVRVGDSTGMLVSVRV